jgi:hypothetical protein
VKPITSIFSALLAVELPLKKGVSPHCPGAFAMYGVAELSLGSIDQAYRFGKLAIAILDGMKSKEASCHTDGTAVTLLTFRKGPFHELSGYLAIFTNLPIKGSNLEISYMLPIVCRSPSSC